jgi:hypothetical protein
MWPSVKSAFPAFTVRFEGRVPCMYTDVLGLVTTGVGNLIDPMYSAMSLPWTRRADGALATQGEIVTEWQAVKRLRLAATPGYPGRLLCLANDVIDTLVLRKLLLNEAFLAKRWVNWATWPADAQLGAHSCAWAAGPGWAAPHFDAAVLAGDWSACAGTPGTSGDDATTHGHAWLRDSTAPDEGGQPNLNPGLRERNLANQVLFANAAKATDPSILLGA